MSGEEEKKPAAVGDEEEDDEEDLEKLQEEIARMEAEAARITKETEELEKKKEAKLASKGGGSGDTKSATASGTNGGDAPSRDGYVEVVQTSGAGSGCSYNFRSQFLHLFFQTLRLRRTSRLLCHSGRAALTF
jgi:hypothetical protein